jgi:glycosyltransferase involved in cell wall biosynthesis
MRSTLRSLYNRSSTPVLLTVSGSIPREAEAEIGRGERPRLDYQELARALPADLLDLPAARRVAGPLGGLIERLGGPGLLIAWACFLLRHRYELIFTDGEQVGLPLAMLLKLLGPLRRPRHTMIVHRLSARKKLPFFDVFRVQRQIDTLLVYSSFQHRFIRERWRLHAPQLVFTPFMVDTAFFSPAHAAPAPRARPLICAVGNEARDYPTLIEAVADLPVDVRIVAGSLWSKSADPTQGRPLSPNVSVGRCTYAELRQIYADAALMVLPLQPCDYQAGITALLEAMAMGKPVICSRAEGQTDVVLNGETGVYVPAADPVALKAAIQDLLADPARREAMGQAGRRRVLHAAMGLEHYVERLRLLVQSSLDGDRMGGISPSPAAEP